MVRLTQQNDFLRKENREMGEDVSEFLHGPFFPIFRDSFRVYFRDLHNEIDVLLAKIVIAKKTGSIADRNNLYKYYTAIQRLFQQVQRANGNPQRADFNTNGFMNLTKKEFTSKYCNASDSLTLQNQLSILEADLLINEHAFLEETQIFLDGCSVKFLSEFAFATSDKFIYKRGDTLKVFANISRFPEKFKGRAIIDGKGADFKDHYFTYSRVITEAPGQYYIPVQIIWEDENKKENIYPARAPFVVK